MDHDLKLYIDGRFLSGEGRVTEPVYNPATDEVLGALPHATAADLDMAVAAATRAFPAWRATSALDRSAILRRAAQLIRERCDHIARIMTREQGKILPEAIGEVSISADIFDWYAEEGKRAYGRIIPGRAPNMQMMVRMEPVGPSAVFTPWNFPALTPARKVAAGLAAGCTVILKASEETPGTAVELMRALHDAGLPAGVANLVFGIPARVSEHLLAARSIRKISFTGSTAVGKQLTRMAADTMKRTTMELGGNAPVIIFPDVDVEQTVAAAVAGKFRNAGQVCVSPSRFFVHESIYDRFVDGFVERAAKIKVDNGLADGTNMGPLANPRRIDAMERAVADAEARGGQILLGGKRLHNQGNFFSPTVVTGLSDDALLLCEETFGPVVPITPFSDTEKVIERANRVELGLAGYAFTQSLANAAMVSNALETGMVGINSFTISTPETPFGGVKESGHGYESGPEGMHAYLNIKFVSQQI